MRITVEGYIVPTEDALMYEWFGYPACCPRDIREQLSAAELAGEPVELWINCYGGDVWAANDIYAQLKAFKNSVTATVTGLAASAATIIMCGADKVRAYPAAQFMCHDVEMGTYGDAGEHLASVEMLEIGNNGLIAVYAARTGKDPAELRAMIERTTWFSAQDAKDYGLIDEIVADETSPGLAASIPKIDIDKLRSAYTAAKAQNGEPEKGSLFDWQEQARACLEIERERFA